MRASRKRPFSKCLRAFALHDNQMSTFNTKQASQKWTLEVLTSFSKRFRAQNRFSRVLIVTTKNNIGFCAFRTLRSDAYAHFEDSQIDVIERARTRRMRARSFLWKIIELLAINHTFIRARFAQIVLRWNYVRVRLENVHFQNVCAHLHCTTIKFRLSIQNELLKNGP